jgi:septum formation protein
MLILASASPRRRELLTQAGYQFQIHPANIPEDPHPNEDPIAYVTRLAQQKAEAVYAQRANPAAIVLGADTTVTVDNEILGKPENAEDAARMLRLLSGRTHRVITGISLVFEKNRGKAATDADNGPQVQLNRFVTRHDFSPAHQAGMTVGALAPDRTPAAQNAVTAAEVTAVQFLSLSAQEIAAYIATGEPNDKAGAYAIQGHAARWIPRIEGCYYNVMGLPISLVATLIDSVLLTRIP